MRSSFGLAEEKCQAGGTKCRTFSKCRNFLQQVPEPWERIGKGPEEEIWRAWQRSKRLVMGQDCLLLLGDVDARNIALARDLPVGWPSCAPSWDA